MATFRIPTLLFGLLGLLMLGLACSSSTSTPTSAPTAMPVPTATPATLTEGGQLITDTTSYRVTAVLGSVVREDMAMRMAGIMSFMDRGRSVNRHLEIHVYDVSRQLAMKDTAPTVEITDETEGTSRLLALQRDESQRDAYVFACVMSEHRPADRHFGDNLYLPDGRYTFTVEVGGETAVFGNVLVKAVG